MSKALVLLISILLSQTLVQANECPSQINDAVAKKVVLEWMKGEMWGKTKPWLAKPSCLQRKTKYRLKFLTQRNEPNETKLDIRAKTFKILSLEKRKASALGTNYKVKIFIRGKDKAGKKQEFEQDVMFYFPKSIEKRARGCVSLHSQWNKSFVGEKCVQEK